jgi:hypothetical protein
LGDFSHIYPVAFLEMISLFLISIQSCQSG